MLYIVSFIVVYHELIVLPAIRQTIIYINRGKLLIGVKKFVPIDTFW